MNYSVLKKQTENGLKWNIIGQLSKNIIQLSFGVLIARILTPEDYGLIGMVLALTGLSTIFIDSGFSSSIIQNKDVQKIDLNTIFTFNLILGFIITVFIILLSNIISDFYQDERLINIVRVIAFLYFIQATTLVQRAYLTKGFQFRKLNLIELSGLLVSGIVGLVLALRGFDYWALVIRTLLAQIIVSFLLYIFSGYSPKLIFSKTVFKKHWKYSSHLLVANSIDQFARRFDDIVVGKFFPAATLGYFSNAKHYIFMVVNMSSLVIKKSFFPLFCILQDNVKEYNNILIKIFAQIFFIFSPLFLLLYVYSEFVVEVLLGNKWLSMVPYFQLFCILGILYVFNQLLSFVINSKGFTKYNLRFEIIGSPLRIIIVVVLATLWSEIKPEYFILLYIMMMCYGLLYRLYIVRKIFHVNLFDLFLPLYRNIIVLIFTIAFAIFIVNYFSSMLIIAICAVISGFLYILLSYIFRVDALRIIINRVVKS